jgi:hypothetical protein
MDGRQCHSNGNSHTSMSDIHIHIDRETPVKVITLEPSGKRGPAGPNTITTSTTTNLTGFISGNGTTISGATAGSSSATPNTLVLRNAQGGGVSFTETANDSIAVAINNSGSADQDTPIALRVTSTGGSSISLSVSATGNQSTGANISSNNGNGAIISTDTGEYHATFGTQGINHSFVARVKGAIGWFRNDGLTARIHPTDTITDDRTYTLPDASGTVALTSDIPPQEVKSANFTAADKGAYITVATLTVTDPSPSEGASFSVLVRNGTATVGGTAYATAGSLIHRVFHSGGWQNYEYKNHAQYGTLATVNGGTGVATALAVNTGSAGAIVVNGGTATNMTLTGALTINSTTYTYGSGAAAAHRSALNIGGSVTGAEAPPRGQLFEDFPNNNSSDTTIGTHGWARVFFGGGTQTFGQATLGTNNADCRVFGVRSMTANGVNSYAGYFLPSLHPSPFGMSMQACFALPVITQAIVFVGFGNADTQLDFQNSQIRFIGNGAVTTVASGLSLAAGDFKSGTRYRLHMRCISATTTEIILLSAPWNSATWTKIDIGLNGTNDIFTHASYTPANDATAPRILLQALEASTKTVLTDWIMINTTQDR